MWTYCSVYCEDEVPVWKLCLLDAHQDFGVLFKLCESSACCGADRCGAVAGSGAAPHLIGVHLSARQLCLWCHATLPRRGYQQ